MFQGKEIPHYDRQSKKAGSLLQSKMFLSSHWIKLLRQNYLRNNKSIHIYNFNVASNVK